MLLFSLSFVADLDSKLEDLWGKAVEKLKDDDRQQIDFSQQGKRHALQLLLNEVQESEKEGAKKRWQLSRTNGKVVNVRDVFGKIAGCIQKFKEVGDNVVQYDPGHAALPWAAVRFVLQVGPSHTCSPFNYHVELTIETRLGGSQ